jgi:type IV pilus assembly protein PilQ
MFVKTILCCLIVVLCLWHANAQSQQLDNDRLSKVDVGRENPYSPLPRKSKAAVSQRITGSAGIEGGGTDELFVETVTLKFLKAKSLKTAIGNMSSGNGTISIDERSNSLIICDTVEHLEWILTQIKKADKMPEQIMIEVVIVDVQLDDDSEIGINWDILSNESTDFFLQQNLGSSTSRLTSTSTTTADSTAFVSTGTGANLTILSGSIQNVLHALQEKKDVEILASPRVMVVSGQTALIEAIEEIPYNEVIESTGGGGGVSAISATVFKDVGVKLKVTATMTDEGLIHLNVDSEQKVKTGVSVSDVPVVDARTVRTSLLLDDGQLVVMGGLRRKETSKQVKQIPLLGDIPLIGLLFKSTVTEISNNELIVFIAPHIYKGEPIPQEAMTKFREITERPVLSLPSDKDKKD